MVQSFRAILIQNVLQNSGEVTTIDGSVLKFFE